MMYLAIALLSILSWCTHVRADELAKPTAHDVEFFEAKIRPVLVKYCYQCHAASAKSVKAGLLLDSAASTRAGGDSGPAVIPGKVNESLLLSAIRYEDFEMPPKERLPDHVIADFERWVKRGAVDPRTEQPHTKDADREGIDLRTGRKFWAFQPPHPADLGMEDFSERIDALVDQQLRARKITANPPADRRTLLRRFSFDLTGLPPTPEEIEEFQKDTSANAVEKQVDRLLRSARYGERWTRLWLDVARYAEDQAHIVGNNKSLFFPNAWRYRDWLIKTFNDDIPYDRFVSLQLAADILEPDGQDNIAALGFIGVGPKYYRRNDAEVMADEWEDRVDVVTRGLQGLTVACARCHDHKYDPIATEDYYALAGVFAGTEMFNRPLTEKTKRDKNGHAKNPSESLHVVRDSKPVDLAVMIRGDVDNKGDTVTRGFIQVAFPGARKAFANGSGRAELAACITDPANPLTARVFVNRIWQQYFGQGIVATTSNFGQLGERPSHPELLDDLAVGFMNHGWSVKWLHRQILLSKTYQRSSENCDESLAADPLNKSLWRMPRRRLSVEGWRDSVLTVCGELSDKIGGPSMKPDDPNETRRTVYSEVSRFELNPLLSLFDFPDPNVHSARRLETNTPLQKLFLLNSPFMTGKANVIASRIEKDGIATDHKVQSLFMSMLQRKADADELQKARAFIELRPKDGLPQLAQVLMSSNEFWFVD